MSSPPAAFDQRQKLCATTQAASTTFLLTLDAHKWLAMPSAAAARPRRTPAQSPDAPADDLASPPYSLMDHPPLALLTNGLLSAFNELRHCALLSLRDQVAQVIQVLDERKLACRSPHACVCLSRCIWSSDCAAGGQVFASAL